MSDQAGRRFVVLDGWRGVCALMVALYHFHIGSHIQEAGVVRGAYLFVDFFFVLSGFVITHAYEARLGAGWSKGSAGLGFLVQRIGRVWPLHAVTLGAMIVLELVRQAAFGFGFGAGRSPSEILPNLLLLHGLGFYDHITWNWPSWSLSVEMALYVGFLGLMIAPARLRVWISLLIIIIGLAVLARLSHRFMNVTAYLGLYRGLAGFFCGYVAYRLWRLGRLAVGSLGEITTLLIVGLLVGGLAETAWAYLAPVLFAGAILVFADGTGWVSRALSTGLGRKLGIWSYSIYLTHVPVFGLFRLFYQAAGLPGSVDNMGSAYLADGVTVLFVLAVCMVSSVTYQRIEMPGQRLFRRLLKPTTIAATSQDKLPG